MNRLRRFGMILYFFVFAMLMFSTTAYAYIDPATSSYVIQVVAGIFIACGAAVGIFWKKIQMFFRKKKLERLEKSLTAKAEEKAKNGD